MEQTKTKKALIMSVLSMVLCIAMLIGMTFAWFTDTASTGVNKIQAGNLDVDIIGETSNTHIDTLKFTKAGATDAEATAAILWEPGCRYVTEGFRIANNGSLALKWKAEINKDNIVDGKVTTDAKDGKSLLDVIDFYVVTSTDENATAVPIEKFTGKLGANNKSDAYYIKGVMQTTAGNDYQNLTLDGITITVYATQDTVENDSYNNQYDKDAGYAYSVDSVKSLKTAAAKAKKGDTIKLTDNITLSETVRFSASGIVFDGNGHTITAAMSNAEVENLTTLFAFGYGSNYCTGVTVKDVIFAGKGGRAMHFHGGTSSVLENVKISGEWSLAINFYGTHGAVMNNCNISSTYANKYAAASIFANEQSANQIILNNTKVDSLFVNATANGATYANDGIKVVVNSGSTITELHTNTGITRTFHTVNGGTVGSVLADQ